MIATFNRKVYRLKVGDRIHWDQNAHSLVIFPISECSEGQMVRWCGDNKFYLNTVSLMDLRQIAALVAITHGIVIKETTEGTWPGYRFSSESTRDFKLQAGDNISWNNGTFTIHIRPGANNSIKTPIEFTFVGIAHHAVFYDVINFIASTHGLIAKRDPMNPIYGYNLIEAIPQLHH